MLVLKAAIGRTGRNRHNSRCRGDEMNLNTALTLLVTVCLALIGYVYALFLARRKDRLKRINRQLSDLYGPLYALSSTGAHVWGSFRRHHRIGKGSFWKDDAPVDDKDADAFRTWMRSVFMPLNRQMMDLVVNRADLLVGTEIPGYLLELCAHISSYEALLMQWEKGDHSANEPYVNFPGRKLQEHAAEQFRRLKEEQDVLLAASWHHLFPRRGRKPVDATAALVIKAAGGVVYRQRNSGERVNAVIHKRKYQEWSLPKGKLRPGESWEAAATREVREEAGAVSAVLGVTAVSSYLVKDVPKIVVFFAMETVPDPAFVPSQEVDRVQWLSEAEVRRRLSHDAERQAFDAIVRALRGQEEERAATTILGAAASIPGLLPQSEVAAPVAEGD
jgi:ADP-ribose pyrophosphatase YjhB (NUDIX family)